jgi:transcriptional regulator with XRE-family HTH domain
VRDVKKRLGDAIRVGRMTMDPPMTQRDLAHAVGVHQPSVSAWELGKTMPSPHTVLTLAALLGLDLADLADPPLPRVIVDKPAPVVDLDEEPEPTAMAG